MKITMNMTDCRWDEERFLDGQDAADYLRKMELDGLELMHCQGGESLVFSERDYLRHASAELE